MQYEKAVLSHAVKVWGERRGQEEPSGCLGDNEGVGAVMLFLKILQFLKIQLQLLEWMSWWAYILWPCSKIQVLSTVVA